MVRTHFSVERKESYLTLDFARSYNYVNRQKKIKNRFLPFFSFTVRTHFSVNKEIGVTLLVFAVGQQKIRTTDVSPAFLPLFEGELGRVLKGEESTRK